LAVVDGSVAAEAALVAEARVCSTLSCPADACCLEGALANEYLAGIQQAFRIRVSPRLIASAKESLAVARELGADLLVVARELDARAVCRAAEVPVLVVSGSAPAAKRYPRPSRIVVGLDGSAESEAVLPCVLRFLGTGATAIIVVVPDGDTSPASLKQYAERVGAGLLPYGEVEIAVCGSGPARTIVETAESKGADLVVVASHGRGGIQRAGDVPLGSVPERLLSELDCALLIVPATKFRRE
jgi:nucleotide-binding universal stress UspA family protein